MISDENKDINEIPIKELINYPVEENKINKMNEPKGSDESLGSISQVFIDENETPVTLSNIYLDNRPATSAGPGTTNQNYFFTPSPTNWLRSTTKSSGKDYI